MDTNMTQFPKTLIDAVRHFSDPDTCHEFMKNVRWPDGNIKCPNCQSDNIGEVKTRRLFQCRACYKQFSTKLGTVFEDSPIKLEKWLPAVWLIVNCKNGVSSYEIGRAVGVTQKSAWFMMHRIRLAVNQGTFEKKLQGDVEADEAYLGGASRFMHLKQRKVKIKGGGSVGKAIVMGLLERNTGKGRSQVRVKVIGNNRKKTVQKIIRENVERHSTVNTDALLSYKGLDFDFVHEFIDHAEKYVEGTVHTNGLENFWSLLKRAIKGTYVNVEPFHLFRYLDEQAYRFNNRAFEDKDRFVMAMLGIAGKRLTYDELTGEAAKELPPAVAQTSGPGPI